MREMEARTATASGRFGKELKGRSHGLILSARESVVGGGGGKGYGAGAREGTRMPAMALDFDGSIAVSFRTGKQALKQF